MAAEQVYRFLNSAEDFQAREVSVLLRCLQLTRMEALLLRLRWALAAGQLWPADAFRLLDAWAKLEMLPGNFHREPMNPQGYSGSERYWCNAQGDRGLGSLQESVVIERSQ
eukprot:Skav234815  [mRNA]  locus=scaffold69:781465:788178:- [translate_table: standard]